MSLVYLRKIILHTFLFCFVFVPTMVLAQRGFDSANDLGADYTQKSESATVLAKSFLVKINDAILFPLIALMMAVALLVFLYGAFEYVRGASNDVSREKGRKHLLYGTIGLLVMLSSMSLLSIAAATFGLQNELESAQSINTVGSYSEKGSKTGYTDFSVRTESSRGSVRGMGRSSVSGETVWQGDTQESDDNDTQNVAIYSGEYEEHVQGTSYDPNYDNDSQDINQGTAENQEASYNKPFTLGIIEDQYVLYADQINGVGYDMYITRESIKGYVSIDKEKIVNKNTTADSYVTECNNIGGTDIVSVDIGYAFDFYCINNSEALTYEEALQKGLIQQESNRFWSFLPWR